jgi:CubicO group peptidase (beta-lactamase class C family)
MNVLRLIFFTLLLFLSVPWPLPAQTSLDATLTPFLSRYDLPALAAAVVKSGEIQAAGAVGTRRAGTNIPVTINDRFHLGSDTKAMTALLVARLVEEGKLHWDSTVVAVFPELSEKMDPEFRKVTLEQLLSHTGGLPSDNETFGNLLRESISQEGNLDELRYWLVGQWSRLPLASKAGTNFAYSNMGYMVVGAMMERVSGKTWDERITEQIFKPLNLKTAGLGPQASLGRIDAPLGHALINGKVKAFLAGPNGDNPPIIGPAGIAHMSILDFARWAGWNAGEGKREPKLIRPETLRKLHTPVITMPEKKEAAPGTPSHGRYALGWGELTVPWAPGPLLYHGGSNGLNLAHIWIDRNRDLAIVTATNISGRKADEGLLALVRELYTQFTVKEEKPK